MYRNSLGCVRTNRIGTNELYVKVERATGDQMLFGYQICCYIVHRHKTIFLQKNSRSHNITFFSAFPPDFHIDGLEEITPERLVSYVKTFTDWDLVGARMRGEEPVAPLDIIRYGYEVRKGCFLRVFFISRIK